MPILHAEIQVGGRQVPFVAGSFSFWQLTDYEGRPSTDVRLGLIELTLVGEAATWAFWESWMLDAHRRQSGRLIFFQNEDQKAKTVIFYDAFCVHYTCRFDARGADGQGSFEVEINLSSAAKEVQGQFSEAHSVIPWDADKDTRYRALSKPADPLPSTSLAVEIFSLAPPESVTAPQQEKELLEEKSKLSTPHLHHASPSVRDATDAESAEIAAIREKHTISRKKNVAYAEGILAGQPYRNDAHSGMSSKPGTASAKPFETQLIRTRPTSLDLERGVSDSDVRAYDSEVKILEELLDQTADNPSVSGKIKVVSERPICESCWDGISQVEKLRPNLNIERVQLPKK
jgi:hypothetical protein